MSYSNRDGYGFCKDCYKQKQFCTCENTCSSGFVSQEITEHCDQTVSEHNPQCQSIGEQEQQQQQQQGGLEQEQGPQIQDQIQEGQRQGPQIQKQTQGPQTQGDQSQGPQTQSQNEIQEQTQIQDQTEDQDQTQGPQLQAQRHGDQTMENNQTISTPVDVDGVNVDVKCGDCKPTIIFAEDFFEERKKKKDCDQGGEDMHKGICKENQCPNDCDCCVQNLAELLRDVQSFQTTITDATAQAIDIYFSTVNGFPDNQIAGQVISDVIDCSVLRFRTAGQILPVPNTAVQLCDVAGICATDTDTSPEISNVFEFLLQRATTDPEEDDCTCKKKKKLCSCPCCAAGIGEELRCIAPYGILVNVRVQGQTAPLPLYVLAVKDCLAYFIDSLTATTRRICVFSLCAISGFTVGVQTIGV